jgi:hypothetical protein
MQSNHCLNCGEALKPSQKYCSYCGQNTNIKRITLLNLAGDFIHSIVKVDKGWLHLIKGLSTKPGIVVLNYVEGKRKQYINPFGFLALCIAISLSISNSIRPYDSLPKANYGDISRMPTEHLKQLSEIANKRADKVLNFSDRNMNIITVFITPYVAFMLWLFFRKRRRNISEIALAYIFLTGFGMVVTTIFIYPIMLILRSYTVFTVLTWLSMILQTLYYAWAFKTFFNYKTMTGFIKVTSVLFLTGFIGFIFISIASFFYIYSGSLDLLYYLSQHQRN